MMAQVFSILGWTLFSFSVVIGLLLNLVGLFGNWVLLGAVVIAWIATGLHHFSLTGIFIMFLLACMGEVIEAATAAYGARRFGGSRGASLSAFFGGLIGAIAGTPLMPIIGTLIGACVGSFIAAALHEYAHAEKSAGAASWTGLGAALGRVAGLIGKFAVGLLILATAAATF